MFCLPSIGVSACAITNGHATSTVLVREAGLHIMLAPALSMPGDAATRQLFSSAASSPLGLCHQAFRSPNTLHDSARGCAAPLAVPVGSRPAVCKSFVGSVGLALCRELEGPGSIDKGGRFSFGGVISQVSEVPYP